MAVSLLFTTPLTRPSNLRNSGPVRLIQSAMLHAAQGARNVRDFFASYLRAVGLALVATTRGPEQPKVLLKRSRKTALARCGAHLLPSLASIAIVTVNLMTLYIGKELVGESGKDDIKLAVLQVCAKVQELLIVSSLGTIIFHVLRSNLLTSDGVNLGLLGSGFAFTQISFFWSTDFLGSVFCDTSFRLRKILLVALLLVSGFIAVFAGPASAVLMIPRETDWAVGGAKLWLNGSREVMWPSVLNSSSMGGYECTTNASKFQDPVCPSAGFDAIYNYVNNWKSPPANWLGEFDITDSQATRSVQYRVRRPGWVDETWSATTHSPAAITLLAARSWWTTAIDFAFGATEMPRISPYAWLASFPGEQFHVIKAEAPVVRTRCYPLHTEFDSTLSGTPIVGFPWIPDHHASDENSEVALGSGGKELIRQRIANAGEPRRGHVLAVPMTVFEGTDQARRGVIVLWPTVDLNETLTGNYSARGCSYATYWAQGSLIVRLMDTGPRYDFKRNQGGSRISLELDATNWGWSFFMSPPDGTWRPFYIQSSWFDVAMPKVDKSRLDPRFDLPANSTTLESLLAATLQKKEIGDVEGQTPVIMTEHVLATLLVDSVSRAPSRHTANYSALLEPELSQPWTWPRLRKFVVVGDPTTELPKPSESATPLVMQAFFHGFVMAASRWFDYFSIILLLSHALMATVFSLLVVFVLPTTSDTWETVPEMLALAQNSPAPEGDALANTSAGIRKWGTPAVRAWVEEVKDGTSRDTAKEQLRLTFRSSVGFIENAPGTVEIAKHYGKR